MANSGAFKKGDGRPRRPKGAKNKSTTAAKEAIELAAEGLGGAKRLIAWAQADPLNERVFWGQIYTKLLPLQVTGENGKDLIPEGVTFVITKVPGADCRD